MIGTILRFQFHEVQLKDIYNLRLCAYCLFQFHEVQLKANF